MNEELNVLYIAGFGAGKESSKFRYLDDNKDIIGINPHIIAPDYGASTLADIMGEVVDTITPDTLLIGHSLGGFIARMVAKETRSRAILMNPSFYPDKTLGSKVRDVWDYIVADIDWRHTALSPPAEYVLVETGDTVVDWRAQDHLHRASWVTHIDGGDHRFQSLPILKDTITRIKNTPWQ